MALIAIITCFSFTSCGEDEESISKIEIAEGLTLYVIIGDSKQLNVKYYPEYLDAPNCTWSSSNSSVVDIDAYTGKYTAKSVGKSVITVTAVDLSLNARCEITVNPIETTSIEISTKDEEMNVGEELMLTAAFTPENATYKDLEWSSSDSNIATVDNNGKVTAIKEGECSIYAKTKNGKEIECKIIVIPIAVQKVDFTLSEIKLLVGDTKAVEFDITPSDAEVSEIKWKIEDESIASISEEGIVTCKNIGITKLLVTINGEHTAECQIIGCGIEEFVSLKFGSSSIISINGNVRGNINCYIINNSSHNIIAKSIQLIDSATGEKRNVAGFENETVEANSSIGCTITINLPIYKPIFRWTYIYNEKEYTIDLRYGK